MRLNLSGTKEKELLDGNGKLGYYFDQEKEPLTLFGIIRDVNLFVGANNSGKSRFLRGILKQPDYVFVDSEKYLEGRTKILDTANKLGKKIYAHVLPKFYYVPNAILQNVKGLPKSVCDLAVLTPEQNRNNRLSATLDEGYITKMINEIPSVAFHFNTKEAVKTFLDKINLIKTT